MKKKKQMRTADLTWLDLRQGHIFQKFFKGYVEILRKNLKVVESRGLKQTIRYFSCGHQPHDKRDPAWEPFKYLWEYTEKTGYDFYVAKDEIEERIGRKIICECQVLNDERAIRRRKLEAAFGVDFGGPGRRDFDIV